MSSNLNDFLARVLVGAIVSSVVSAGILYFAFDQSLRGVEAAVTVVSEGISQNGEWIRANGTKIDSLGLRIEEHFDELSATITEDREANFGAYATLVQKQRSWNGTVAASLTTTVDLFNELLVANELSEDRRIKIVRLLERLEGQQSEIEQLGATYDVIFTVPR